MTQPIRDIKVYLHRNPKTGVIFYVGIGRGDRSTDFVRRSRLWHRYVEKHGEPIVEVFFDNCTKEEAFSHERALIKGLGRRDKGIGTLLNLTDGGEGVYGRVLSDEAKEAIRAANLGRKWTDTQHIRYSKSKMGVKLGEKSEYYKKIMSLRSSQAIAVVRIPLSGGDVVAYTSIGEAARSNSAAPINIKRCCDGKHKTIAGFKWKYHYEYLHD